MNIWDVERPVGLDGKPIALGGSLAEATHKSEARMNAHLAQWEASNLEQTDKLTQKLRKEYDELRMANKQRQRAMTQVCGMDRQPARSLPAASFACGRTATSSLSGVAFRSLSSQPSLTPHMLFSGC